MLIGEPLGESVEKADKVARECAFVFVNSFALRAVAVGEIAVVLAHRNHVFAGICLENRVDLRSSHLKHLGIGQTPLAGMAGAALTVDKRVIFGVRLAVAVGR